MTFKLIQFEVLIMTSLYMLTDLQTNNTKTVALDSEDYYRLTDAVYRINCREYRYQLELVEQNKPLNP